MKNSRDCERCGNIIRCGEYWYVKYINHQEIGRSVLCPGCIKALMAFLKTPPPIKSWDELCAEEKEGYTSNG